jgi:hypothetical protein
LTISAVPPNPMTQVACVRDQLDVPGLLHIK